MTEPTTAVRSDIRRHVQLDIRDKVDRGARITRRLRQSCEVNRRRGGNLLSKPLPSARP
jgi:hypothetical protein